MSEWFAWCQLHVCTAQLTWHWFTYMSTASEHGGGPSAAESNSTRVLLNINAVVVAVACAGQDALLLLCDMLVHADVDASR